MCVNLCPQPLPSIFVSPPVLSNRNVTKCQSSQGPGVPWRREGFWENTFVRSTGEKPTAGRVRQKNKKQIKLTTARSHTSCLFFSNITLWLLILSVHSSDLNTDLRQGSHAHKMFCCPQRESCAGLSEGSKCLNHPCGQCFTVHSLGAASLPL